VPPATGATSSPDGDLAVVVGDAAGRGAQACPLKALLQPAVRRLATGGASPAEIIAHLRRLLWSDDDLLATVVYLVVEPGCGRLALVNAGHPPPLLVGVDEGLCRLAAMARRSARLSRDDVCQRLVGLAATTGDGLTAAHRPAADDLNALAIRLCQPSGEDVEDLPT
jgi:hypothetical protein